MNETPNSSFHRLTNLTIAALALLLQPDRASAGSPSFDYDLNCASFIGSEPIDSAVRANSAFAGTLHDTYSGAYTQSSVGVTFGDAVLHETSASPGASPEIISTAGDGQLNAHWHDLVTITTSLGATGTAHITMFFEGGASGSPIDQLNVGYNIGGNLNGGGSLFLYSYGDFGNGQWQGTPAPATFTYDVGFNSGQEFDLGYAVSTVCYASSSYPDYASPASANVTAALHSGGFTVVDAENHPVNFTAESKTGSSRGQVTPQGGAYGGFSVTNHALDRLGSTFQLIDGTASSDRNVVANFVAPVDIRAGSDVVNLTGTDGDLQVVQIDWDPPTMNLIGPLAYLEVAFLPLGGHGRWESAVLGNYQGPPPTPFTRAYNPATDFHLGYYGIDQANHKVWAVINHNSLFAAAIPFDLVSVVSRKTHGAAGVFDINMPLTGTSGVECRTGGAGGNHTLVFTFKTNLVSGEVSVTGGSGIVSGAPTMSANTMTVNLSGVTNAQKTTVTLHNMKDVANQTLPDTAVTVGFLLGDTNNSGGVTASDIGQTKANSGQNVTAANFRSDVNVSGTITATDIGQVKAQAGTVLPP
jgi:hypothetical protein